MIRGFLLVCFLAEMGQTSPCSENQHRLMQGEFSECRNNYYNSYNSGESESGVCTLLDEIMTLCTNIWKQCHTEHEINRMKTDHLELLISHMGLTTQNCQIVRESKTASTTTEGSELGCSNEETTRASEHFHSCSAVISEQVHASVVDAVEPVNAVDASSNNIHHILCQGLHKISAQCPRLLKPCFKPSDIVHMRSSLMDNMRTFFKRLAIGKLPPGTTLENCKHRNKQANPRRKKQEAKNEIKHLVEEQQHNEPQLPQEPLQQHLPSPPQPQPPTPPPQQQPQPPPQQQQLPHPPPPQQQQPPHQQQLPQQPPRHQQPQHPPRQQLPQQPPRQPQPKTNDSPQPKSSDLTSSAPNGRLQILFLSLNIFMSLFCL